MDGSNKHTEVYLAGTVVWLRHTHTHIPGALAGVCAVHVTELTQAEAVASWGVHIPVNRHHRTAGQHFKHLPHLHIHLEVWDGAPKLGTCGCSAHWEHEQTLKYIFTILCDYFMFLLEVSHLHKSCVYLKTVLLWHFITI